MARARKIRAQFRTPTREFTHGDVEYVDYKDVELLQRFLNEQGNLMPRRITGAPAKFQRQLTRAVKRARHMALLAFVAENVR